MDVQATGPVRFATITALPGGSRLAQFAVAQDQTLDGTVVTVDRDTLIIQIGRQRVQARSDADVRPGDSLRLLVREAGDERVVMQILGKGEGGRAVRALTGDDLSAELTRLGLPADDESAAIARELIARGLPLTAANVLDIRAGLARLRGSASTKSTANPDVATPEPDSAAIAPHEPDEAGSAARPPTGQSAEARAESGTAAARNADVRAAVFLKLQNVPVTPDAIRIVRQALATTSSLGEQVEGLRHSLADLAVRLAGGGSEDASDAMAARVSPEAAATSGGAPPASPDSSSGDLAPPGTLRLAGDARPPGSAQEPARALALTPESAGESAPTAARAGSGGPAAGSSQGASTPTSTTLGPAPQSTLEPVAARPQAAASGGIDSSTGSRSQPADGRAGASGELAPSGAGVSRLLSVVTAALDVLPVIDRGTVEADRLVLADRIREVVAEQGTPLEAKLARVLEGVSSRAELDRALANDLRGALQNLSQELGRRLEDPRVSLASAPGVSEALAELRSVRTQAESILANVELQQLGNAASGSRLQESYLVFQLPIPGGHGSQTVEIRVRQDGGEGPVRIDPRNAYVVFQFELEGLRTVRIGIRFSDQRLSCHMGSSDPDATTLLQEHATELRAGLAGLGYLVDDLRCATLTAEDLAPRPEAERVAESPSMPARRVDARI